MGKEMQPINQITVRVKKQRFDKAFKLHVVSLLKAGHTISIRAWHTAHSCYGSPDSSKCAELWNGGLPILQPVRSYSK